MRRIAFGIALTISSLSLPAPSRAQSDNDRVTIERLRSEGRYAEAISALKRYIAQEQAGAGLETPLGSTLLNNLGELYYKIGRPADALPFYTRALAIAEKTGQSETPATAVLLRNFGIAYQLTKQFPDAEASYLRSIAILEKTSGSEVQLASTLSNLATFYEDTKRAKDAEQLMLRVLKVYQTRLPPGHLYISTALNNLGQFYRNQHDPKKAQVLLAAAIVNLAKTVAIDHPVMTSFLQNLGLTYVDIQDWPNAVLFLGKALNIVAKQTARATQSLDGELSNTSAQETNQQRAVVGAFVNSAMKLLMADQSKGVEMVRQIFLAGQLRPSATSASLLQMSARRMSGDGALEKLVRERQDLVREWQMLDRRFSQSLSDTAPQADANPSASMARLQEIDGRVASLDRRLGEEFSQYTQLANPKPAELADVQKLLRDDEALILFIETASPSWVWVVTKTGRNLALIDAGRKQLETLVAGFRCGLDSQSWTDPATLTASSEDQTRRKREQEQRYTLCRSIYAQGPENGVLPFDLNRAHALYQTLLGNVAAAIQGKQLIIVPSESLVQLPFNALVTAPPGTAGYRDAKWLGTGSAIRIVPSVASFVALRSGTRSEPPRKPFIGFGNPLLDGLPAVASEAARAKSAREKQTCSGISGVTQRQRVAVRSMSLRPGEVKRGQLADVTLLRQQLPLPETADELCAIASRLNAKDDDVWLGQRATETAIKDLSRRGRLADYAVIDFATHGLIAGNLPGLSEPAVMLTPPATPSDEDDGLLTASEVMQLKINANWVVLSACNTASGGSDGAEALSGLTRAFFYAGARSLLVTHWEVDSEAAVAITTGAFAALKQRPAQGRAEALRRSMAELVADASRPTAAHPATWAAFTLVGEAYN